MAVAGWSWLRACAFVAIVCGASLVLTWSWHYVADRRTPYESVRQDYASDGGNGQIVKAGSPIGSVWQDVLVVRDRIEAAARVLQLLVAVVLLVSGVASWFLFDPRRFR